MVLHLSVRAGWSKRSGEQADKWDPDPSPAGSAGGGGQKEADTIMVVPDPGGDPRSIATGRAATAAKTCGKVNVLTSTPPGCRTSSPPPLRPTRGRCRLHGVIHGSSGLRPSTRGYGAGTPEGCNLRPRSCGIDGRERSVRAGVLCAVRPVRRYGASGGTPEGCVFRSPVVGGA